MGQNEGEWEMNHLFEPINFIGIAQTREQLKQKRVEMFIFWGICIFASALLVLTIFGLTYFVPML